MRVPTEPMTTSYLGKVCRDCGKRFIIKAKAESFTVPATGKEITAYSHISILCDCKLVRMYRNGAVSIIEKKDFDRFATLISSVKREFPDSNVELKSSDGRH